MQASNYTPSFIQFCTSFYNISPSTTSHHHNTAQPKTQHNSHAHTSSNQSVFIIILVMCSNVCRLMTSTARGRQADDLFVAGTFSTSMGLYSMLRHSYNLDYGRCYTVLRLNDDPDPNNNLVTGNWNTDHRMLRLTLYDHDAADRAKREVTILQRLADLDKSRRGHFLRLHEQGYFETVWYADPSDEKDPRAARMFEKKKRGEQNSLSFTITERVPLSLADLMSRTPLVDHKLPNDLAKQLLVGVARALHCLHSIGYVHRCVSPACVYIRTCNGRLPDSMAENVVLTNLGFVRKYAKATSAQQPNALSKFTGTLGYSSVRAHQYYPQTPLDDYTSVCYMAVEMMLGWLYWRYTRNHSHLVQKKLRFASGKNSKFKQLPPQLRAILKAAGDSRTDAATLLPLFEQMAVRSSQKHAVPHRKARTNDWRTWLPVDRVDRPGHTLVTAVGGKQSKRGDQPRPVSKKVSIQQATPKRNISKAITTKSVTQIDFSKLSKQDDDKTQTPDQTSNYEQTQQNSLPIDKQSTIQDTQTEK